MRRETISNDELDELDELIEALVTLRADPPEGMDFGDLPTLPDLAGGDPQLLALLEVRLERAMAKRMDA
jgi:hypothetical protein